MKKAAEWSPATSSPSYTFIQEEKETHSPHILLERILWQVVLSEMTHSCTLSYSLRSVYSCHAAHFDTRTKTTNHIAWPDISDTRKMQQVLTRNPTESIPPSFEGGNLSRTYIGNNINVACTTWITTKLWRVCVYQHLVQRSGTFKEICGRDIAHLWRRAWDTVFLSYLNLITGMSRRSL
jgi:hypothetical protein